MSQVKIENVQKNFDYVLDKVGSNSFINWNQFSHNSSQIINIIDEVNKKLSIFRQCQHRNFIQSMKKLKSLDLPDLIGAVKNKKLPRQALRGVLSRFKIGQNQKIELVESVDTLKQNANKVFEEYIIKNNNFVEQIKKYQNFLDQRIKQSGYVPQPPAQPSIKATVKFDLSDQLATKIASQIKIQLIPGTNYIGFKTYSQIVGGSYQLVKLQNHKLSRSARAQQRANMKDEAKYLAIMNEYIMNCEALVIEGQKLLAQKIGLKDNQLQESQSLMIERGLGNHLLMIQSQLRTKVKQSIPPTQDVSYQVAKQVISHQTIMLSQKKQYLKKIFDGVQKTQQSIQIIPMILALILNDLTFEKYGYEQQDFMKNVNEEVVAQKPELVKIFQQMQVGIIKLMEYIGVVSQEVGNILQKGAIERQLASRQSGIMQNNTNTMQMLQKQQFEQLLAAKKGQK